VSGLCVTTNNGFWIGWLDLLALLLQLLSIIFTYNSSQSMTKTRSIPYRTTSVFSSTVTDLVLIYESVTSSASVVRWLILHSWTFNSRMSNLNDDRLTNELVDDSSKNESINYVSSIYNSGRTKDTTLSPTFRVLFCFIRCHGNALTETLSSNGLFSVYSLSCKRVLIS
jgi:hypothetical protein